MILMTLVKPLEQIKLVVGMVNSTQMDENWEKIHRFKKCFCDMNLLK